MLNPWQEIAKPIPIAPESIPKKDFLTQMPVEIILEVHDYLSVAERVALSLTCRALYQGFFESVFPRGSAKKWILPLYQSSDEWKILQLLEKQADETEIACWVCGKIHAAEYFGGPQCHEPPLNSLFWHLPLYITPDICRLIGRRDVMGQPYDDIMEGMTTKWQHVLPDFKIYRETRLKMFNSNLVYRDEQYIAPLLEDGRMTVRSARLLMRFFTSNICTHWSWDRAGFEFWSNSPFYEHGVSESMWEYNRTDIEHSEAEKTQLEWNHPHQTCGYNPATISQDLLDNQFLSRSAKCALRHPQPCIKKACLDIYAWGKGHPRFTTGCCSCSTEFCLGSQDVEGVGRALILTVWKNLGGFGADGWKHWDSHHDVRGPEDISNLGGFMAKAFDSDHSTGFYFKAKIGSEAMAALLGKRSPTWSMADEEGYSNGDHDESDYEGYDDQYHDGAETDDTPGTDPGGDDDQSYSQTETPESAGNKDNPGTPHGKIPA